MKVFFCFIHFFISCNSKNDLKEKSLELSKKIEANQEKIKELNALYQNSKDKGEEDKATNYRKEILQLHTINADYFEAQKRIRKEMD